MASGIVGLSTIMPNMLFVPRYSHDRGHTDHGWLKTFHTFSFSTYQDPNNSKFGCLRVLNEDRVAPDSGFPLHTHQEFEIFSYIVSGSLEHKDSMGNTEILKRGDVQLTSAGTGIQHSEMTHGTEPVHFLQIWTVPSVPRLEPSYYTRHITDEEKRNQWVSVVVMYDAVDVGVDCTPNVNNAGVAVSDYPDSVLPTLPSSSTTTTTLPLLPSTSSTTTTTTTTPPTPAPAPAPRKGPAPIHSPLSMYATLLHPQKQIDKPMLGTRGYVHLVQASGYNPGRGSGAMITVFSGTTEVTLREGDGLYVLVGGSGVALSVGNSGDVIAEIVLFDIQA